MKSSISVANKLLALAQQDGKTLTPMQLIKLVFLCHGWMLGLYGRHLIKDAIEAWQYGPVIPLLYQEIKQLKSAPVNFPIPNELIESFDDKEEDVIRQVFEKYSNFSGIELSALTHEKNSPWDLTWNSTGTGSLISNDLIEYYYRQQANPQ